MKNDRFLNGILAGIGILILIALLLFFVRQNQAEYIADDTPRGVVHNYTLSVIQKDYEKAYSYLVESNNKPSLPAFQQGLSQQANEISQLNVTLGETFIDKQNATVQLSLRQYYEGPFNNLSRYSETAQLVLENGDWKIVSMPYPLWSWNWYPPTEKVVP
jgi:hypothetical protein